MSEETSFKVTDRRLFNADGTARELSPEEKPPDKPLPELQETPVGASPREVNAEPGASAEQPAAATDEEAELPPDVDDPASFANFLMSIASNAASSLGMMEHPVTRKREVDLELGKHWIDVLGMLQQKTRGNLSPQEQQILEGLLADLRMQFVSLANSPSQPKTRGFTSGDITGGK